MKLKPGAQVRGISTESLFALMVTESVYREEGLELTVTSVVEGTHGAKSRHWSGDAFDCRTQEIPLDKQRLLAARIRSSLGGDFDVVLELDHIHVEYDPKGSHR